MKMANAAEILVEQINSETISWIILKIKELIEKYKGQLLARYIYCDVDDWFTVQAIDKFYEIGEVLNRSRDDLAHLLGEQIVKVKIGLEEGEIYVYYYRRNEGPDYTRTLYFPGESIINFSYVDHKNLGETLEKLRGKVEELLSIIEKKLKEAVQVNEEALEQWRQSKIYLELSGKRIIKEFEKKK